ncbi:MAG: PmoA family protein, partial [Bacteroidales bacterium]|nr:PmoA family protein [Bacteroidales bacterium]
MKKLPLFLLIGLSVLSCSKKDVLRFEVYSGELPYFDCPVSIDISSMDFVLAEDPTTDLNKKVILKERSNGRIKEVPVQITRGDKTLLWLVMEGITYAGESRNYRLILSDNEEEDVIEYSIDSDEIRFYKNDQDFFRYRRSELLPPEGVDMKYKRSGYIHPLVSPGGEVLTRIQPPDHYHHYGIWNPWTKTHINGREIDYWNLGKGQGTVRHKG